MNIELYRETALLAVSTLPYWEEVEQFDKTEKGEWIGFEKLWNFLIQPTYGFLPDKAERGAFKANMHLYAKEFNKIMGEEIEHLCVSDARNRKLYVVYGVDYLNPIKKKYADIANGLHDDGVYLLIERELDKGETNGFYCLGNLGIYGEEEPAVQEPDKPKFTRLIGMTIDGRDFEVENVIQHEVNEQYGSLHYICSENGKKREGYIRYSEIVIMKP